MKLSASLSLGLAIVACLAAATNAQVNCDTLDFFDCVTNWMVCTPYAEFPWTVTYGIPGCRAIECYDRPQYECTPGMGCEWDATNLACKDDGAVTPCWDRKTPHGCGKTDGLCAFDFDRNFCVNKTEMTAPCMYSQESQALCEEFPNCVWFTSTNGANMTRCVDHSVDNYDHACDMLGVSDCFGPCYLVNEGGQTFCQYSPPMSQWGNPPPPAPPATPVATTNFWNPTTTFWTGGCIICTTPAPSSNAGSVSSVVAGIIGVAVFVGFMALVLGVYKGAKALQGPSQKKSVITPIQVKPAGADAFTPGFEVDV